MTCPLSRGGSRRRTAHKRKSHRKSTRKSHRKSNRKTHHRRERRRGGQAPVGYSLAGDWSSVKSLGQGGDFLKYHVGQHGGNHMGAPLSAITNSSLPAQLRGPAHMGGLDGAFRDIAGLKDQAGGRRKHKKHSKKHSKKQSRKHRKSQRRRGGALGYAPLSADTMLLKSPMHYAQAGLNPEWRTSVEFDSADMRASQ